MPVIIHNVARQLDLSTTTVSRALDGYEAVCWAAVRTLSRFGDPAAVPIASLGERYGVSVRGMESIIRLACIIHHTDYWRRGRTVKKLGIGGLSVSELTRYVNEGIRK